jgi:hypothetical protein
MKQGGGEDHLAIAWQYPGQPRAVIPAKVSRVTRFDAMVGVWKRDGSLTSLTMYPCVCRMMDSF